MSRIENGLYMFNSFIFDMVYAISLLICQLILPVTSQPGFGKGNSIQGLGRGHIQKSK